MKRVILALLGSAAATQALPQTALAREPVRTALVRLDGVQVDSLLLRYPFDAMWAVSDTEILLRDTQRGFFLVNLKAPCNALGLQRDVAFVPALAGRVKASLSYEARDAAGPPCDVASIGQISAERAATLRASLSRRP